MSLVVVKFGGSLAASPERDGLLAAAAAAGAVVVPGGGAFADAVRAEQRRLGFGDRAAHAMAILAMDQTACALADAEPDLALCASPDEFAAARSAGRGALWRPSPMALAAELPESWDLTSDSLSAWLAATLAADRLIILKAGRAVSDTPSGWAAEGLVDPMFPAFAARFRGAVELLAPATADGLAQRLATAGRRAA